MTYFKIKKEEISFRKVETRMIIVTIIYSSDSKDEIFILFPVFIIHHRTNKKVKF